MGTTIYRLAARLLIVSMLGISLPMHNANAALIGTENAISQSQTATNRARVEAFMGRADVQTQMEKMGIPAADAQSRVAAMTDDEVNQVAGNINTLPAGGVNALAIVLIIFIILVITDLLGWTKIFPWQIGPRS